MLDFSTFHPVALLVMRAQLLMHMTSCPPRLKSIGPIFKEQFAKQKLFYTNIAKFALLRSRDRWRFPLLHCK